MGGGGHGHAPPQVRPPSPQRERPPTPRARALLASPLTPPRANTPPAHPALPCLLAQYTGFEAAVRQYFPENYHVVYMVLGGYATIVTLFQIRGSFAKTAAIAAMPAPELPDYHTRASCWGALGGAPAPTPTPSPRSPRVALL